MSDTFFKNIHISNFKSLKEVTLSDCKRINLLIGKPNVGKSNILEAIGLFSLPHFALGKIDTLDKFTRLEHISELFFDGNIDNQIRLNVNSPITENIEKSISYIIGYDKNKSKNLTGIIVGNGSGYLFSVDNQLKIKEEHKKDDFSFYNVKLYHFTKNLIFETQNLTYLIPPYGVNLFDIVQNNKELKKDILNIFSQYGLKLVFDKASQTLKIIKEKEDDIFLLPYSSIADTLQRVIFFKTAIASNENSILLFEEPEAHCFPPYIKHIAKEIISSESNQFFIATHSPFILDTFLEDARTELAIYMADFKDGQTVIKRLTDNEVEDVFNYGLDLFFNAELFTDEI